MIIAEITMKVKSLPDCLFDGSLFKGNKMIELKNISGTITLTTEELEDSIQTHQTISSRDGFRKGVDKTWEIVETILEGKHISQEMLKKSCDEKNLSEESALIVYRLFETLKKDKEA